MIGVTAYELPTRYGEGEEQDYMETAFSMFWVEAGVIEILMFAYAFTVKVCV